MLEVDLVPWLAKLAPLGDDVLEVVPVLGLPPTYSGSGRHGSPAWRSTKPWQQDCRIDCSDPMWRSFTGTPRIPC